METILLPIVCIEIAVSVASLIFAMESSNMTSTTSKNRPWIKAIVALAVAVALFFVASHFNVFATVGAFFESTLDWIREAGPLGSLIFMLIYVAATVLFLPASVLTLGAGAVFGVFAGAFYVIIAATIGANLSFLIGRYLARDRVAKMIEGNAKFRAIDQAVAEEGWKIIGLIRLSPAFPFNVLNYALGLTQVSFRDNLIGTAGIIPGTFMYVYIGSLAGSLAMIGAETEMTQEAQIAQWAIRIVGLIATIAVTIYVTRIARKALQSQNVNSPGTPESDPSLVSE